MIWPERSSLVHVYANPEFGHTTFSLDASARLIVAAICVVIGVVAAMACSAMMTAALARSTLGAAAVVGVGIVAGALPLVIRGVWRWSRGRGEPGLRRVRLIDRIERDGGGSGYAELIADHLVEHWLRLGRAPGIGPIPLSEWRQDVDVVEKRFGVRLPRIYVVGAGLASELRSLASDPRMADDTLRETIKFKSVARTRFKSWFWIAAAAGVASAALAAGVVSRAYGWQKDWLLIVMCVGTVFGAIAIWRRLSVSGLLLDGARRIEWRRQTLHRANGTFDVSDAITFVMRIPDPLDWPARGRISTVVRWTVIRAEPHEPIIIDDLHPGGTPWAEFLRDYAPR